MEDLDLKDYFNNLINYKDFGNLIIEKVNRSNISIEHKGFGLKMNESKGFSVELERNGQWAVGYSSNINKEEISNVVSKLYKKLTGVPQDHRNRLEDIEANKADEKLKSAYDPREISDEQKIELVRDVGKYVSEEEAFDVRYSENTVERVLFNTAGSEIRTVESHPYISIWQTVEFGGKNVYFIERVGEDTDFRALNESQIQDLIKKMDEEIKQISKQPKNLKSGIYDVVLDQRATGALTHEIVGHVSEATNWKKVVETNKEAIGTIVGSECLTFIDDPTIPKLNGSFSYDQEGIKARKKVLIDKGVRKEYMHTLETASLFGCKANGSARAININAWPTARMSNIYLEAGDYGEEIVSDIKEGIMIYGSYTADVNSKTGNFKMYINYSRLIENGELGPYVNASSIFGNAFDILKSIDAVGKDKKMYISGCLKDNDFMPVGEGGPMVRIRNVMVNGW